jgi:predicted RNA-binding Zn ribbon-like protein
METLEQVDAARPLLIVGGNLALDFANTVDDPGGPRHFDHIGDMHRLLTWAQNRGLFTQPEHDELRASIHEHQSEAQRDLEHLHLLRHTLQIGFTDVARGQPFPTTSWHQLRKAVANAIDHADLTTTAVRGQLHWTGPDFRIVEWSVAHATYELLTGDRIDRIKHCASCPWLFLDQSKNGSRRWCSMDDCGTNAKIRRYVAQRAARRGATA